MRKISRLMRILALVCTLFTCAAGMAQQHTLTIQVSDSFQVAVSNPTLSINKKETVIDSTGIINRLIPPGKYHIVISAVGHFSYTMDVTIRSDTLFRVMLRSRESLLGNVVITASRNLHRNQMSTQSIGITQLKKMPVILGEVDPLKAITLLPGIKNGGEASAGIYVRGGGPDQNLVLMDGIPVYNPSHLLGFFSVFNGDAVKNVDVIKGGMPAEYGGRLSSVILVDTREGDKDSLKVTGGIGLISSRLSVEGPLVKKKSSFIISARRTYIDQVAKLVARDTIGDNGYFFYDVNAKADYVFNKNNSLNFTFYTGRDNFSLVNKEDSGSSRVFNAIWGNTIVGLTWKQQLNKQMKHELSVVYNRFNLDSKINFGVSGFVFTSGLNDYQIKNDWSYASNNWLKWKWGFQYIWHNFKPGAGESNSGVQEFKSKLNDQFAREAAAYISTDINLTPTINIIAGLRYSYFNQIGPTERVIYDDNGAPTGETERYGRGQSIARYHYPEPRISTLYKLPGSASIKVSYTNTVQYLHLATTSAATFPSDLWIPVSKLVKPGKSQQIAAGYFRDFNKGTYEVSAEAYYKTMSNQIEFKPGAQLLLNQNLEGEMTFGSGKAYGIEFFLQKKKGRLNGWLGYTLSRAERTFPGMNGGKSFPYRYDRTHDVSLVVNYTLSSKWDVSGVFVYGTGNALTMPTGRFVYNIGYNPDERQPIFTNINQYDKINDYRMPAYHRMDIAFTYTPKTKSTRRFKSSWNFSVYNVYNRYNPYFIYIDVNEEKRTIQGKKVFLFPVVPSVTWNFKF